MSEKNKKQFGIWMDTQDAIITGRENIDNGDFVILDRVTMGAGGNNSSEYTANNQQIHLTQKYFKEIVNKIPNMDEVHVTGTGQIQEQFIKFLADTAQYKNAVSSDSTSNKMSDDQLLAFMNKHFN